MSTSGSNQLSSGAVLGRYQLGRRLGAGGMGEVFEARHLDLGKVVALKTLHGAGAARPEVQARFVREGQAAARIRHPNAADVTDVGVVNGVAYLVMEMLQGEDLQGLLRREGCLSPGRIAAIMLPTLSALSAAHEEGIVHRDLKPANIFLHQARDGSLVPKVLDFGISKMSYEEGPALTGTSAILGTPAYMSPEQLMSTRDVDLRSDIYSMGVVLYECATGVTPFRGDTMFMVMSAVSTGVYTPPRQVRGDIPEALEQVIQRAMSREPSQRFASAAELAQALAPFAEPGAANVWGVRASAPPSMPSPSMPSPTVVPSTPGVPSSPSLSRSINTLSGNTAPTPEAVPARRGARWPAVGAAVALLVVGGLTLTATLSRSTPEPSATPTAPVPTTAPAAPRRAVVQPPARSRVAPAAVARVPVAPAVVAAPVAPPAPVEAPVVAPAAPASPVAAPTAELPAEDVRSTSREPHGRRASRRRDRVVHPEIVGFPMAASAPSHPVGTNAMPVMR